MHVPLIAAASLSVDLDSCDQGQIKHQIEGSPQGPEADKHAALEQHFPSLPFIVSRMASLREVICQLTAIVDNPTQLNAPLEWPIPELRRCLKHCSFSRLDKWRKRVHKEYDNQIAQDLNFYVFQDDVWDCLTRASDKSHQLRLWTKGKSPTNIRFNFTSRRHLVSSALTDILEAFKHFSAMNGRPVGIVFKYIKKCYEFMIHLGSMLYPHGESDSWYSQLREYLVDAKLDGFNLNGTVVIEVAADPTFAFSILDPASMPATCLPLHPQPPMVTVTKGPYGPRLSRNLYWVQ
ncbi:hypothetical protein DL98DRAFT_539395 [Cadophora sp. DSE1049]|nr:hypothetical protein DL98DRAFT_539395 [Cadophora sp. DSE1049]